LVNDAALFLSAPPLFSFFLFCRQFLQFLFNILTEFHLAFQDTAWSARNAVGVELHAVFGVEIEVFAGKGHDDSE